jgi:uncharacterized protein (TIGR03437 family)
VPIQVRAEGLTEQTGDVVLQCAGLAPRTTFSTNLTLFFPAAVTNRIDANNRTTDAVAAIDYGTGYTPSGVAGLVSNQNILFNGLQFTVPDTGAFNLKISGVRVNAYQFGALSPSPILASVSFALPLGQPQVVVGFAQPGVLATQNDRGIPCTGSPAPASPTMAALFAAGTSFATTRVTEGFGNAFRTRGAGDDNGTRFLMRYAGFPAGTTLYVPDFIAGYDAAVPTSAGDLGLAASGGAYLPGSGTLLLARVPAADSTGAGGTPVALPPAAGPGPVPLGSASTVPLSGGAGYAVYEVLDSNATLIQSAQIPTFIALPHVATPAVAQAGVSLAPVSTVFSASTTAPVTRFAAVSPQADCQVLGDCAAGYFPHLSVQAQPVQLTASGGVMTGLPGYIPVQNAAGGTMLWNASPEYQSGSGWITLDRNSGQDNGSVRVYANPKGLAPGTYQGDVLIDAGPMAGNARVPVTLVVAAPAPPATPPPPSKPVITVDSVLSAATLEAAPAVSGSLTTLMGSNFAGKNLAVAFDGLPAVVLYSDAKQINLQVPDLGARTAASLVVTVDGNASAPRTVVVSPAWPAIFHGAVLNQDNSVNGAGSGAAAGTVVQAFATGIPAGATVSAQIGGQAGLVPLYAGPAPTLAGVQQVNVMVPRGIAPGASSLTICAEIAGQRYCSPSAALVIQ